jgi:16S rRNA (guanine966-N2)-methyltransferase
MRVIAGRARGRRLRVPDLAGLRPTSDRARETLFSILTPILEEAHVLDLFAGCGALGLEAVSRGARRATFVERHRKAVATLRANITSCQLEAECTVIAADYRAALRRLDTNRDSFDLVFADPPYDSGRGMECLELLRAHDLVATGAHVVLEQRRDEGAQPPQPWSVIRTIEVGGTVFLICSCIEPGGVPC